VGDGIYVTGPLGGSAAGRELLGRGCKVADPARGARARWRSTTQERGGARLRPLLRRGARGLLPGAAAELLARHLDPVPRLPAGRFLSARRLASAAMDLSDGLSLDLARLCEASGVGAVIHEGAIPISQATRIWAARGGSDETELALHGGEDYELLFTAPASSRKALSAWPLADGTGPILIGRVRPRAEGIRLADTRGRTRALPARGYDPFRRRARAR